MLRSVASGDCGLLYVGFDVLGVVVFVPPILLLWPYLVIIFWICVNCVNFLGLYSLSFENFECQSLAREMEIRNNNVVSVAKFVIQNVDMVFIFLLNIGLSPHLTFRFKKKIFFCNQSFGFLALRVCV